MRILYICTYYHRAMIFRDSMDYLEKRGHQVLAFNAVAKGAKVDDKYKAIMDDKVVHRECFYFFDRYFFRLKQRKIQRAIEDAIDVSGFDLIHSHTLFNGGWAAYQLHKKHGVPYIVSVRNTDLNSFLRIPLFKRIAKKIADEAVGVLFLSEPYKEAFLSSCYPGTQRNEIEKKCAVITNGLEPFWLERIGEAKQAVGDPLEMLCVGKIDQNKNLETTLKVLERLNKKGCSAHLTVIGQVLDNSVMALLDGHPNVSVISYLKKEELIAYYRKADLFIMPSINESFGRVYAEAMTQGLPVIYTRGQGFDGLFAEGEVGYSVRADSVDEIESAVLSILDHYHAISANCIEKCRIFNWEEIAEHLEAFYFAALKRANRHDPNLR